MHTCRSGSIHLDCILFEQERHSLYTYAGTILIYSSITFRTQATTHVSCTLIMCTVYYVYYACFAVVCAESCGEKKHVVICIPHLPPNSTTTHLCATLASSPDKSRSAVHVGDLATCYAPIDVNALRD